MRNIFAIMSKEIVRVIKSPSMLVTLLMPGLLIYGIFSFMNMGATQDEMIQQHAYIIHYDGVMPAEVQAGMTALAGLREIDDITFVAVTNLEESQELLASNEIALIVRFPQGFVGNLDGITPQQVDVHFNPVDQHSNFAFSQLLMPTVNSIAYAEAGFALQQWITWNTIPVEDDAAILGMILASLLPMFVIIFLFSGASGVVPESIAGEKERGTMATLLASPIKRSHIIIGKVVSLSLLSVISALSSFIGIMASLAPIISSELGEGVSVLTVYSIGELALMLLIMATTVFLVVALMSIFSTIAKNVKEAVAYIGVVMVIGMIAGMLPGVIGTPEGWWYFLIPFYNVAIALEGLLNFQLSALYLGITLISNLVYTAILIGFLTVLFNSERIMFS